MDKKLKTGRINTMNVLKGRMIDEIIIIYLNEQN